MYFPNVKETGVSSGQQSSLDGGELELILYHVERRTEADSHGCITRPRQSKTTSTSHQSFLSLCAVPTRQICQIPCPDEKSNMETLAEIPQCSAGHHVRVRVAGRCGCGPDTGGNGAGHSSHLSGRKGSNSNPPHICEGDNRDVTPDVHVQ